LPDPLVYARAIHFAATIVAAGTVLFAVFIGAPAFRVGLEDGRLAADMRAKLFVAAWIGLAVALLSGAAWLVLTAASMSGQSPADVLSGGVLWTVLTQTDFGNDWLVRLIVAGGLAIVLTPLLSRHRAPPDWLKAIATALAAIFVGSLAWSGHGAEGLGVEAIVHPIADVLHLVAAAAWLGALLPLALLLHAAGDAPDSLGIARIATLRFSTLGIVSVATLLATGLINSWYLVGGIDALTGTAYGRLLIIKVALFFAMVAIAAFNRLILTSRIMRDAVPAAAPRAMRQLSRNAAIEASLGAVIIGIVGVLGTLPPASHAHHHVEQAIPADASFQHIHGEDGMADVMIEPGHVGTAQATIHLLNNDLESFPARQVTLTLTPPVSGSPPVSLPATPVDDDSWQVSGVELSQAGNWTVTVTAVINPSRTLVLTAPIVIDPEN
jgi:putative copper resistance protein D